MKKILLAAGALVGLVLLVLGVALVGPSHLPQGKEAYAGTWLGDGVALTITPKAKLHYIRQNLPSAAKAGGVSVSSLTSTRVDLPVTAIDAGGFTAGRLLLSTRFVVNHPPEQVDGAWKMTVDGTELTRNSRPDDDTPTHVGVSCKGGKGALTCTADQRGLRAAFEACFDLAIGCANGGPVKAHACARSSLAGSPPQQVPFSEFAGIEQCQSPAGISITNLKVHRT
jgi:hypothetical protein